jgi:hypothetical protein
MPQPFVITLPADDEALRDELIAALTSHAEVHEAPPSFGLNEVKLVIEIIGGSVGILANAAAIATFLLMLRDRRKKQSEEKPLQLAPLGEPAVPLESAADETVRQIVGAEEK